MADTDIDQDELQRRALQGEILGLPPNIAQQTLGIPPATLSGRAFLRNFDWTNPRTGKPTTPPPEEQAPQPIPKAVPASQSINPDVAPPPLAFPPQPPSAATMDPVVMPAGGPPKQSAWLEGQKPGWQQIHNPFLRGLAGVGSTIADIAAPGLSSRIPGTGMHHDFLVHQALGREAAQGQEAEREAQTEEARARAAALQHPKPQLEMTKEGGLVRVPEQGEATPVTMAGQELHKPTAEAKPSYEKMADGSIVSVSTDANGKQQAEVVYKGDPAEQTQIVDQEVNGQPHNVIIDKRTGNVVKDLGRKGHEAPNVGINLITPAGQVQRFSPGQTVPQGSMTPSQAGSLAEGTTMTRQMSEAAPKVVHFVDRLNKLIDAQETSLGPAAGRWNEFMTGKVGAPNADFARLRTDYGLLQTMLMRMHVGARGGEYIMKHFSDLLSYAGQSPENMRAALDEVKQYANDLIASSPQAPGAKKEATPTPAQQAAPQGTWNLKTGKYE